MKDLGILYISDLSFSNHVCYAINKAKKKLGFIIRSTSDFTRPSSVISLFKSLVSPILSYSTQIWSQSTQNEQYELERVV